MKYNSVNAIKRNGPNGIFDSFSFFSINIDTGNAITLPINIENSPSTGP